MRKKAVTALCIILVLFGFYTLHSYQKANEYLSYLNERWELNINRSAVKATSIKTKTDWHSEQYILFKAKAIFDLESEVNAVVFKEFYDTVQFYFKESSVSSDIKYLKKYTLYQPEPHREGPLRDDLYVLLTANGDLYILECMNLATVE